MTDTYGEMNLQSKQDIICHVEKPATSAHYVVDVIPFLAYIIFPSNQRFDKARKMYFAHSKEKVITRTSTFTFLVCKQSPVVDSLMTVDTQSVAQQLTATTYDLFTPCSRLHHKPYPVVVKSSMT